MLFFFIRIIITTVVIVLTAHLVPGLEVQNTFDAICFGLILGCVNAIVRPVLIFLTLPITILTLGLFTLVINVFTFWLASEIAYGVYVATLKGAFIGGLIIWLTGFFTNRFLWHSRLY